MSTGTYDPWAAAAEAKAPPSFTYGQIAIDTWPCVLEKGKGKVVFDAAQHSEDARRTVLEISVNPLAAMRSRFTPERSVIAESPEWYRVIWPSLKVLGLTNPKDAVGKWCKMEQVPTGRKYRNAAGEEREATTFKFLALYDSEAACEAAYLAESGRGDDSDDAGDTATVPLDPPATTSSAADPGRDTARAFVAALTKQHHGDLAAISTAIAGIPSIAKYYPPDSEDLTNAVLEIMRAA